MDGWIDWWIDFCLGVYAAGWLNWHVHSRISRSDFSHLQRHVDKKISNYDCILNLQPHAKAPCPSSQPFWNPYRLPPCTRHAWLRSNYRAEISFQWIKPSATKAGPGCTFVVIAMFSRAFPVSTRVLVRLHTPILPGKDSHNGRIMSADWRFSKSSAGCRILDANQQVRFQELCYQGIKLFSMGRESVKWLRALRGR